MRTLSNEVAAQAGKNITVCGWIHKKRLLGGLNFLNIRDRKGLVQVLVENKDAGFIVDGMEVRIKVDSFNYTKYGFIPGIVVYVAPDAVLNENIGYVFPCKIKLSDQNILIGKKYVSLFAGMTVTADIKIGERPVIDYFLTNFVKYQDESFREI